MNKKALEQERTEIYTRLKDLGDLDVLVKESRDLPALVNDMRDTKVDFDNLVNDLPKIRLEFENLNNEFIQFKEQFRDHKNDIRNSLEEIKASQEKTDELRNETMAQLGLASNAKLAHTFEGVKKELMDGKNNWFAWLVGAVIALVVITAVIIWWQFQESSTIYELNFLVKLALTSPFVYFVVFVNREFSRARALIEEYTFKAAISRSFEAYKDIVHATDSEEAKITLDFIVSSIKSIYSSPMENIKSTNMKQKENSPDPFSKISDKIIINDSEEG